MTIVISLAVITVCSVLVAAALNKATEEIFSLSIFSIVLILLPFYCLNLLLVGKFLVYAVMFAIMFISIFYLFKQKKRLLIEILNKITPGICLYLFVCAFILLYVRENKAGLWDELRLWAAVPKALFETNELQLGKDALIFTNMQSYPPGMSLLVYFFTGFAPAFAEYYVFAVYGILFSSILLPALKNLKWRHCNLFVPLAFLMVFLPCLFTSHNNDHSAFYLSLFIDGLLGALIGNVFYLSIKKPFESKFKFLQYCLTIAFLINIKHSAISFAIIAIACAIVLYLIENKKINKSAILKFVTVFISAILPYLIWSITTKAYGVSNHLSMDSNPFSLTSIKLLFDKMLKEPMLNFTELNNTVTLSFVGCVLLMMIAYYIINKIYKCTDFIQSIVIFSGFAISFLIFSFGYISIFPITLLSYNRYYTTLLYILLVFIVRMFFEGYFRSNVSPKIQKINFKKIIKITCSIILSVIIIFASYMHFKDWIKYKHPTNISSQSILHSEKILNVINNNSDIYLLISGDKYLNSLLHHRIYFDLLGSGINVRNYYDDVNVCCEDGYRQNAADEEFSLLVNNWSKKLLDNNYKYLYITSVDDVLVKSFAVLGVNSTPEVGDIFSIENDHGKAKFILISDNSQ